ncbi:MAG: DUF4097 family beta strand repeat protein [Luteitalea sp.]|nr:DUF4097 family beta strand repeat protein [Luteitalea sp.]
MKMRSVRPGLFRLPVAATLVAPCLFGGCVVQVDSEAQVATEHQRFAVDGTPEVTLATFDGSVEVRTWDRPEVVVDIEKRGATVELLERIQVSSHQEGNRIRVEVRQPSQGRWGFVGAPQSARVTAFVPAMCHLRARSDDGSISVEGVDGQIELRTADGSVTALKVKGDVRAHTGDGRIKVEDMEGRCDLTTGDGSVTVTGRLTGLSVRTGDGSVTVRAFPGSHMGADWDVESGDGAVLITLPTAFSADVDASTGDGRIQVGGLTPELGDRQERDRRDRDRRSLRTRLGVGGHLLKIRTSDGSIALKSIE